MANSDVQFHPDLMYKYPDQWLDGTLEYVQFDSIAGNQAYGPSSNLNFNLRSQNYEGVDISKSYMTYDLTQTGTAVEMSALGATAVFSQVSDTMSGKTLPPQTDIGLFRLLDLVTDSAERKSITALTEYYGSARVATNTTAVFPVTIPLITTLSSCTKILPLMALTGGWNINYLLSPITDVYPGKSVGTYSISNVRIVAAMVKPTDTYLKSLQHVLGNGGSLKLPLCIRRDTGAIPLTSALTQSVRVAPGYYTSLNSVTLFQRATTGDRFISDITTLDSYFINLNSNRYPKNFAIKTGTENLFQFLSPMGTSCGAFSPFVNATSGVCRYSWKTNGSFAQGIEIRDGSLSIEGVWNTAPTGKVMNVIAEIDVFLTISATAVDLVQKFDNYS